MRSPENSCPDNRSHPTTGNGIFAQIEVQSESVMDTEPAHWILFLTQLPVSPSSLRVMVWRKLRAAGAASLQNGVWVLPNRPEHAAFFHTLLEAVIQHGGGGQILTAQPTLPAVQAEILNRFQIDRAEEYGQFEEKCRKFQEELDRKMSQQLFSFARLEESEHDLHKLQSWLEKIRRRDWLNNPKRALAEDELAVCRQMLHNFAMLVYQHEGLNTQPPASPA